MQNQNDSQKENVQKSINKSERKKSKMSIIILIGVIIFIGILSSREADMQKDRGSYRPPVEQVKKDPLEGKYKIVFKMDGNFKYFNVYLPKENEDKIIAINDQIFEQNKQGTDKMYIRYFSAEGSANGYFAMSDRNKDIALDSYTFDFKWAKDGSIKKLNKNSDGKGKWETIKTY